MIAGKPFMVMGGSAVLVIGKSQQVFFEAQFLILGFEPLFYDKIHL